MSEENKCQSLQQEWKTFNNEKSALCILFYLIIYLFILVAS